MSPKDIEKYATLRKEILQIHSNMHRLDIYTIDGLARFNEAKRIANSKLAVLRQIAARNYVSENFFESTKPGNKRLRIVE